MSTCRRMQIDPYLSPCTKLKSKWIKDLNVKADTLNLIEEKIRNCDLRICDELHKLEFEEEMSDKALIETAKRLQEIRRQRRVAKNEKAVGEMMIEITEKAEMASQIRHIKDFIVSAKDRMYRVRVPEAYVPKEETAAE